MEKKIYKRTSTRPGKAAVIPTSGECSSVGSFCPSAFERLSYKLAHFTLSYKLDHLPRRRWAPVMSPSLSFSLSSLALNWTMFSCHLPQPMNQARFVGDGAGRWCSSGFITSYICHRPMGGTGAMTSQRAVVKCQRSLS